MSKRPGRQTSATRPVGRGRTLGEIEHCASCLAWRWSRDLDRLTAGHCLLHQVEADAMAKPCSDYPCRGLHLVEVAA